ncbi:phage virion morphogenesis protein [[Haemophilus] felis]|nr:phage virion morphogenesis protein [[Haemophilus] felis]
MIKINLNDTQAAEKLHRIANQLKQPRQLYGVLGETLKKIHTERFKQEVDPDGNKWKPLSPITQEIKGNDKILKHRGYLSQLLAYNYNDDGVEFGSDAKYARLHQFGGVIKPKKGKRLVFGKKGSPVFAKESKVPARPWLGVNSQDEQKLLQKATALLQRQIEQNL